MFGPQLGHWVWKKVDPEKLRVDYYDELEWEDLMVWFALCHQGAIVVKHFGDGTDGDEAVEKAFHIVAAMKGAPWAMTKQVLMLFKEGAEHAAEAGEEGVSLPWI